MELLEQNPIRCWHVLGPPSLHVAKAGNTPNPSLIVIGQLGVLVFVDTVGMGVFSEVEYAGNMC